MANRLTTRDILSRLEKHEDECSIRYENIQRQLDSQKKVIDRMQLMLWSMYPFILASLAFANYG
tara:strand:- start:9438 stop:9629 length:192 start_codon:yes stop_codon:yes gene_type:complete